MFGFVDIRPIGPQPLRGEIDSCCSGSMGRLIQQKSTLRCRRLFVVKFFFLFFSFAMALLLWQFKIVDEVKRSNDEKHFVQLLASKSGWRKFGPESSARCEEAMAECSPLVKHYVTLGPMVAYKVALAYANDTGLMYYRAAMPHSPVRLLAKPCAQPLVLSLEVRPAKTGTGKEAFVQLLKLTGDTLCEKNCGWFTSVRAIYGWIFMELGCTNVDKDGVKIAYGTKRLYRDSSLTLKALSLMDFKEDDDGKVKKTHLKR